MIAGRSTLTSGWHWLTALLTLLALSWPPSGYGTDPGRVPVKALYIPLADHYAALVAYERYGPQMKYADFELRQMKNWDLLRAYFQSGRSDMAFVMSPLAMDMFNEKPHFRWVALMHRDGIALAINRLLNKDVQLPTQRHLRKPDAEVANALKAHFHKSGQATEIATPHPLSTHTVLLYHYLKQQGLRLSLTANDTAEVLVISVAPPKSPAFLKAKSNRAQPAAFEQSLPWADIVKSDGYGQVAWYSKDLLPGPKGHVDCIALATDSAIKDKFEAIEEVVHYIHQAGQDIEAAREQGGPALDEIVSIIQRHIPAHPAKAIIASLDPNLRVINYQYLQVDKAGLRKIMQLALEGNILKQPIDIDAFTDHRFSPFKHEFTPWTSEP